MPGKRDTLDECVHWEAHQAGDEGITRRELLNEVRCYETLGETTAEDLAQSIERLKQRACVIEFRPDEKTQ